MLRAIASLFDPMVRMLLLAILLATVLPAVGEARGVAQLVSNAAIFLLFFLNGLRLPRNEILRGLTHIRFHGWLVIWCFGVMALLGLGAARLSDQFLPPLVALGFVFLGCLPSTVQSATAYTSLANGNVANSVVAAALLNILGVFVSAPLFALIAGSEAVAFGWEALQKVALILLLPFVLGQILQGRWGLWVAERKAKVAWMDRIAISIAVYVAFSGAVEQGIWQKLPPIAWAGLVGLIVALLFFTNIGAWILSGLLSLSRGDRKAFLFAGGQKSVAMGAPLAAVMFAPEQAGLLILPLLLYHLLQLMAAAPMAARLART